MNYRKPRFSVIISAYNLEDYIVRAIKSVLNQDFRDFELIVINDASTDNTLKKIKQFKNIKIINNKKNKGLGAVRNIGISKSKGEYIIHLDGDDTMFDNKVLSKIDKLIGNTKYDIVFLGFQDVGGLGKLRISTKQNSTKKARIICDTNFSVSSKCWNKEFLELNDIKFEEGIFYEDMIYSIKSVILAKKLGYGDFPIFKYYRNRKGSIMTTPNVKRCSDMYRVVANLLDLYDITPDNLKPYLLSFIKNETDNLLPKVKNILEAIQNGKSTSVLSKREYKFVKL